MPHAYVIEIDEVAVGLVVRRGEIDGGRRYRFYAASAPCRSIEGKLFNTPEKARKAAIALMEKTVFGPATRTSANNSTANPFKERLGADAPSPRIEKQ